ncbi:MAG: hypothetical protein ABI355_15770 [Solirubrobacteraceae bacterium]
MATLVSVAVPASVNANYLTLGVKIAMRTVNNSPHGITASSCPTGYIDTDYKFGTHNSLCKYFLDHHHLSGGGGRFTYTSNPFGETIRYKHKTLYFYARNPSVGLPFIEVNGDKVSMVEGELVTRHVSGATVRLHREGDREGHKQMTIEIISMG